MEVATPAPYLLGVLRDMQMEHCKTVATPAIGESARTGVESPLVDDDSHARYRRVIGKLIWTLQERPDLCAAVIECARAVAAPTEYHVTKLKRICRYIAGTVDSHLTLSIDKKQPADWVYLLTDASWARGLDRRSTSGIIVQYRGVTVGVWSRIQKPIAHSSCEAEITAASMGRWDSRRRNFW